MGYLDGDSITVDAVLTKLGRRKLAEGSFGVSHFALADDGVDYGLWNTSHPTGSDSYDDAISSLPMVEAVPDDGVLMRYKLSNGNRYTITNPTIKLSTTSTTLKALKDTFILSPETLNFGGGKEMYEFTILNSNIVDTSHFPNGIILGGKTHITPQSRPGGAAKLVVQGGSLKLQANPNTDKTQNTQIIIVGQQSGNVANFSLTVNKMT
jgi:hypothetical protein